MGDARERCRLGHAVSLNHRVAESSPKTFRLGVEGCTSGDERPEPQTEQAAYASEAPPVSYKVTLIGGRKLFGRNVAGDFLAQSFKHARNCHHYVDLSFLYFRNDLRRFVRFTEVNFGAADLRNNDAR